MVPDKLTNKLYYGDNLDVLRRYVADESVDLVYLDPPFNSNATYNMLFKEHSGEKAASQIKAFEDTWSWDEEAARSYFETVQAGGSVGNALQAFYTLLGDSNMMAYLAMMAPRLVELRRVLKPTGSIYLHCDPTASHYLKLLMDAVFGPENFVSEVVWRRTSAHSNASRKYAAVHDILLFYGKRSPRRTWNKQFKPYSEDYIQTHFIHVDPDGRRFQQVNMHNPSPRPNLRYDYTASNGITYKPHPNGWVVSREKMEELDREGRLFFPAKKDGRLRRKLYLDEMPGTLVTNLWADIPPINSQAAERLGYPTQKPEALLERIITASSNEGDVVLDPFCGCGTAVAAAHRLKRRWVGIDVTYLSIAVMKSRLATAFGLDDVPVIGQPTEVEGARALALDPRDGRYQFQWWALGMIDAQPVGGVKKKGADSGIDGIITFTDAGAKLERVIVSVKSGGVNVGMIRDLIGTLKTQQAAIGVFLTLEEPTKPMRDAAAQAGSYHSELWNRDYARIQILSVADLLEHKRRPDLPAFKHQPFKPAQRIYDTGGTQDQLPI